MQSLQVSELETKTNSHLGFSNCQAEVVLFFFLPFVLEETYPLWMHLNLKD